MTYASGTEVSVERSRSEIEATLKRYGASHFGYFTEPQRAVIAFQAKDRRIRFDLPLPDRQDRKFTHWRPGNGSRFDPLPLAKAEQKWEQACRERWRALGLCIKAKLESVEAGIESFEEAFLAHVVMPDGRTVAEHARPRIAQAYESGQNIPLLEGPR